MRLVVDTNVIVSGLGWGGPPAAIIDAIFAGTAVLVTSPPLLHELDRVLRYPKLSETFPDPARLVAMIATVAEQVVPTERLAVVRDEPDNRVLEAAITARADAIVTGDRELLALKEFDAVPILPAVVVAGRL